jgi:hypothetical protein
MTRKALVFDLEGYCRLVACAVRLSLNVHQLSQAMELRHANTNQF